jgi:PhnB protein
MQLHPYLNFNGQCEAAFKFYEQVLGGKITFTMTWGEMPGADQFPAAAHGLIMHTTLSVGDAVLMGADSPPGQYEAPKGMHVSLHFKDIAEGERIFNALAERGVVQMPFQATFWSPGFGMCVDQFGIPWMVNCEQPA